MKAIEKKALQWLFFSRDTGVSSEAICCFFLLGEAPKWSAPSDPADFGRCHRFLEIVPEWRKRVGELGRISSDWGDLTRRGRWDHLEALYLEELPTGRCPKLYAEMKRLRLLRVKPRAAPCASASTGKDSDT